MDEFTNPFEQQQQLNADIFGGDSDLSSNDSDEEVPIKTKLIKKYKTNERQDEPDSPLGESSSESEPEDGNFQPEQGNLGDKRKNALQGMKFKKAKRVEGEEPVERKKKSKKVDKVRQVVEEEEEEEDTPAYRKRMLYAKLDAIIKKPKNKQTTRNKKTDRDDDLEAMNDELLAKLRVNMLTCADEDIKENDSNRPAIHKLRMLPEVVQIFQKASMAESLVENGLLECVKRWLEPLNDGSLPALNIQRVLFAMMENLPIETSALKASGLGRIIFFYTKCTRVELSILKIANKLVSDWMRPIIRRSKTYADKNQDLIELIKPTLEYTNSRKSSGIREEKIEEKGIARRHARIPEMLTASFSISPALEARDRGTAGSGGTSVANGGQKFKDYKKKLLAGQQASRRV